MLKAAVGENSVIYRKVNRQNFCKRYAVVILFLTGLVFAIGGIVCGVTKVFEDWVEREIKKAVVLKPGKEVYRKWLHPKTPVYYSFYMFNVTNPEEVIANGTPSVQEMGPYTYRAISEKVILSRNKYTSSSITYLYKKMYVFVKDRSCKTCDPMVDNVTNINLPFLTTIDTIIKFIQNKDPAALPFALRVLDDTFKKVGLKAFQTLTVQQLLWGHRDDSLAKAHDILLEFVKSRDPTIDLKFPDSFALKQNNTVSVYTIDSGRDDVDNVGKYLLWNNKPNITCWNSKYAAMINGTGASRFQPYLSKDDILYMLETSAYRSFKFIYDSTTRARGIRLYSFTFDPDQFVTGDINGDNKGFCVHGKEKKCLPTGLMDLSQCHPMHAPIVLSLPHFYLGDPKLPKTIKGLNPEKQIHGTFIEIEPHIGLTMQGHKRMQINVPTRKIHGITAFKNIASVYLPLIYIDQNARLTEDDADDFKDDVLLPLRLSEAAPFILLGIAVLFFFAAGLVSYSRHRRDMKRPRNVEEITPLLPNSKKSNQKTYDGTDA